MFKLEYQHYDQGKAKVYPTPCQPLLTLLKSLFPVASTKTNLTNPALQSNVDQQSAVDFTTCLITASMESISLGIPQDQQSVDTYTQQICGSVPADR